MSTVTKVTIAIVAVMSFGFTAIGLVYENQARAMTFIKVQEANPTITINVQESPTYTYEPADIHAKAGQPITVTNNDSYGLHSVTADDRSFSVDVPPNESVTFTIEQAGAFPYNCTYHPGEHNPATINVS